MKKTVISQLFVVATVFNLSLYSQQDTSTTENLKEREQTAKKFVLKKLEEGMSSYKIRSLLWDLVDQTPEGKIHEQIYDQYKIAKSKLEECRENCSKTYCQTLEQEYDILYEKCRHGLRQVRYTIDSNTKQAWSKLEECRKNCSTTHCKELEEEVDKIDQEFSKTKKAKWNTPEGKLYDTLLPLMDNQDDIRIVNDKIRDEQKSVMRPLKSKKAELEEKEEALLKSLKAELSQ